MSTEWPESAKSLLEKRYECFTKGDVDFILESHHPETKEQIQRQAVEEWSKNSKWHGLKVDSVDEKSDKTVIDFTVIYERDFEKRFHREIAEFKKHEGKWFYFDSSFPKPETIRNDQKIGRNDPCTCGSGKKFKKCHGA
ncbi:MAG: hypothetical protein COV44_04965 [Deltaproteobacteria bacterium CG11_big_fil_rev_8_21_14_0_20_45_16]|nr:MAG: hypothetical protein COV44_04965 [Deltaproteobacteria bacterium CG11_big_fil_rev_8_21_14_0_20_45_16]